MSRSRRTRPWLGRPGLDRPLSLLEFAALIVVVPALMLVLGYVMPGGS